MSHTLARVSNVLVLIRLLLEPYPINYYYYYYNYYNNYYYYYF